MNAAGPALAQARRANILITAVRLAVVMLSGGGTISLTVHHRLMIAMLHHHAVMLHRLEIGRAHV